MRIWSTDLGDGAVRWTAVSDDRTVISLATRDQRPHTAEVDLDGDYETIRIIDADGATRSMTRRWLRSGAS